MQWYGHTLRKVDNITAKTLEFKVQGSRGKGGPKRTWKKREEDAIKKRLTEKNPDQNRIILMLMMFVR